MTQSTQRRVVELLLTLLTGTMAMWFLHEVDTGQSNEPMPTHESPQPAAQETSIHRRSPSAIEGARHVGRGDWSEAVPSWSTPTFHQRYSVNGAGDIEVIDEQLNTQTGSWASVTHYGAASFDVAAAASAHLDLFCFAGFASSGDLVLERWAALPVMHTVGGQSVQVLTLRGLGVKRLCKREIYRGAIADRLAALDFDAEGRFVLALVESGPDHILYRFNNEPSTTPVIEATSTTLPELASMKRMRELQHVTYGRVWELTDQLVFTTRVALIDDDNDGVFNGTPMIGDQAYFQSAGFDDGFSWVSLLGP